MAFIKYTKQRGRRTTNGQIGVSVTGREGRLSLRITVTPELMKKMRWKQKDSIIFEKDDSSFACRISRVVDPNIGWKLSRGGGNNKTSCAISISGEAVRSMKIKKGPKQDCEVEIDDQYVMFDLPEHLQDL